MSVTYRVRGLDKFIRNVQSKSGKVSKGISVELSRSALRIERQAKTSAPWDTGLLSNSIYSVGADASLQAKVVSPVYYSIYVEMGTRKMMAQPFLFPAVQAEFPVLMSHLQAMFR
ncbi:MAG: HK97 gp10 family phage protein [Aerococcus sp.]|nr:HK97 gp10 family phage protein [Aerococcus sp.]